MSCAAASFKQTRSAVLVPSLKILRRKCLGKITRTVSKHQFGQPIVVKPHPAQRQLGGLQFSQLVQAAAVSMTYKAAIKVFVNIRWIAFRAIKDFWPDRTHVWQGCSFCSVDHGSFNINVPLRSHLGGQPIQISDHDGRLVEMYRLQWQAMYAFRQIG